MLPLPSSHRLLDSYSPPVLQDLRGSFDVHVGRVSTPGTLSLLCPFFLRSVTPSVNRLSPLFVSTQDSSVFRSLSVSLQALLSCSVFDSLLFRRPFSSLRPVDSY